MEDEGFLVAVARRRVPPWGQGARRLARKRTTPPRGPSTARSGGRDRPRRCDTALDASETPRRSWLAARRCDALEEIVSGASGARTGARAGGCILRGDGDPSGKAGARAAPLEAVVDQLTRQREFAPCARSIGLSPRRRRGGIERSARAFAVSRRELHGANRRDDRLRAISSSSEDPRTSGITQQRAQGRAPPSATKRSALDRSISSAHIVVEPDTRSASGTQRRASIRMGASRQWGGPPDRQPENSPRASVWSDSRGEGARASRRSARGATAPGDSSFRLLRSPVRLAPTLRCAQSRRHRTAGAEKRRCGCGHRESATSDRRRRWMGSS